MEYFQKNYDKNNVIAYNLTYYHIFVIDIINSEIVVVYDKIKDKVKECNIKYTNGGHPFINYDYKKLYLSNFVRV